VILFELQGAVESDDRTNSRASRLLKVISSELACSSIIFSNSLI
jgi:hypothetical protein